MQRLARLQVAPELLDALGTGRFPTSDISQEVRFNCPFCVTRGKDSDSQFHLYVNPLVQLYYCQRCEAAGNFDYLYKRLGITRGDIPVTMWDDTVQRFFDPGYGRQGAARLYDLELADDHYISYVPSDTRAQGYLTGRGLSLDSIDRFGIGVGLDTDDEHRPNLANRIIVPDKRGDGTWAYYVARAYTGRRPKYMNPSVPSMDMIYRADEVRGLKYTVVTEGVFSAMAFGAHGVATYGKHVARPQVEALLSLDVETFFVCLDTDAVDQSMTLCRTLREGGHDVRFIMLPKRKDPGDFLGQPDVIKRWLRAARRWTPNVELEFRLGV